MCFSRSFSHSSICPISSGLCLSVSYSLKKVVMVVVLLLLLSGDIETNPGPVGEHNYVTRSCQFNNLIIRELPEMGITMPVYIILDLYIDKKLTPNDLGEVLEKILDISAKWYQLGLQLKVKIGRLESIQVQSSDPEYQLLEMLKTWLTTSENASWKILTDALRSQSVGASQLAGVLQAKYCLVEETKLDIGNFVTATLTQASPLFLHYFQ